MDKNNENVTPSDLIKKHIENKDHVVTGEELQKMKVGDEAVSEDTIKKEAELKEEELHSTPHLPNPYDVL